MNGKNLSLAILLAIPSFSQACVLVDENPSKECIQVPEIEKHDSIIKPIKITPQFDLKEMISKQHPKIVSVIADNSTNVADKTTLPAVEATYEIPKISTWEERRIRMTTLKSGEIEFTLTTFPDVILKLRRKHQHNLDDWQLVAVSPEGKEELEWSWQKRWGIVQASEDAPANYENDIVKKMINIDVSLEEFWNLLVPYQGTEKEYFEYENFSIFNKYKNHKILATYFGWETDEKTGLDLPKHIALRPLKGDVSASQIEIKKINLVDFYDNHGNILKELPVKN